MKYTIEGFNQRNAISIGLNSEDLVLLRWFVDFKNTNDMRKIYLNNVNDMGYWVSYSYLIQELPILFSLHPSQSLGNYNSLTAKEKIDIDKKYIKACKQKIKRMLSGNLSKVLLRNQSIERNNKGRVKSDIYIYINPTVFKLLISDDITEVQKCTTDTEVQKCTTDTEVQKCTIYPSTNNIYSYTTQSKQKSKDFSSSKKNKNVEFIEKNTHLILSKFQSNKVKNFDLNRLEKAIEIFKEREGQYFSLLEKIYKDSKNFIKTTNKNKFHNFNQSIDNISEEELMKKIEISQNIKFGDKSLAEKEPELIEDTDPLKSFYERAVNSNWCDLGFGTYNMAVRYAKKYNKPYAKL
ncbi:Uncharacterised protein [uncultured Clostridium sp.]|nr:Uncharacterised protein [uncultured Clostridium sp.]SCJ45620.1 Uncharacterised protein [uncultured Clostridium sp.]